MVVYRSLAFAAFTASLSCLVHAELKIQITQVDGSTYHVVCYPVGSSVPPHSPFIPLAKSNERKVDRLDKGLPSFTAKEESGTIILTLAHDKQDRLYGAGNLDRNLSGSLLHPEGNQIVGNGVTRIPYLWSTGGWSALVTNNQLGISWKDENGKLIWKIPGSFVDLYLSSAKDGYGLLNNYSKLTGRASIPPRWSFGFLMSRWGYSGFEDIKDKWKQFRDRHVPVDAFIYDYDWFENDWEFNRRNFPTGSLAEMKAMGLRFVGIRKPRLNDANKDYAQRQQWTMTSPQGTDMRFDNPVARHWWWTQHLPLVNEGVDGWWNDEAEQTYDEFFGMTQTQWEGGRAASPQRVWSINRAFAPGIQRFGTAFWAGDTDSNWNTLANMPGLLLNWSLAGQPYVGQDLGGFIGQPSPELYVRWMQQGVFQPIMRAHGMLNLDRWPWAFGNAEFAATKKAIELRYRLLPLLYTLAEQSATTGAPMMRPLFLEFPSDAKTFDLRDEWLLGPRLLAAPMLTQGETRSVYLPAGRWYDLSANWLFEGGRVISAETPLDAIPAYVRAGTILPLGPIVPSTATKDDALEVRVYPGANATFSLYEDDGETYAYERGASSRIPFRWDDATKTLTVGKRKGSFAGMMKTRHLSVALPTGGKKELVYEGREMSVRL